MISIMFLGISLNVPYLNTQADESSRVSQTDVRIQLQWLIINSNYTSDSSNETVNLFINTTVFLENGNLTYQSPLGNNFIQIEKGENKTLNEFILFLSLGYDLNRIMLAEVLIMEKSINLESQVDRSLIYIPTIPKIEIESHVNQSSICPTVEDLNNFDDVICPQYYILRNLQFSISVQMTKRTKIETTKNTNIVILYWFVISNFIMIKLLKKKNVHFYPE